MRCVNCDKEIPDTAKVCGYCGHRQPIKDTMPSSELSVPSVLDTPEVQEVNSTPEAKPFPKEEIKTRKPIKPKAPPRSVIEAKPKKRSPWITRILILIVLIVVIMIARNFIERSVNDLIISPTEISQSEDTVWGIRFFAEEPFSAYYWSVGAHKYNFKTKKIMDDCLMEQFESDPVRFNVSTYVKSYPDQVYLRIYGLYTETYDNEQLVGIQPSQVTMPVITFWNDSEGYTYATAEGIANSCAVYFSVDDGDWQPLVTTEIFILP